jgi:drug/metabolite transporter (DMT)-like permease
MTGFSVAQGLQYLGLYYLPAVTVTFLLNFTPVFVLLFELFFFREFPVLPQFVGMILALGGAYLFFLAPLSGIELKGLVITLLSGLGWATFMISSREFLKSDRYDPLKLTSISMFFGAIPLTISAILIEGFVELSLSEWAIVLWLSLINTALAFVLWNFALEKIRAFELSILQNTMLIQIGILAYTFLGEQFTAIKIMAMAMVFIGVIVVQLVRLK